MTEIQRIAAELHGDASDTNLDPCLCSALEDYANRLDRLDAGDAGVTALRNVLEVHGVEISQSLGWAENLLGGLKTRGYILVREP